MNWVGVFLPGKTDEAIAVKLNEAIGAWKRDGTLTATLVRWLPYLRKPS